MDEPWAEFSTLEVAACHAMHLLHSIAIQPNLELKTRPKQLLGSNLLDIALPACLLFIWHQIILTKNIVIFFRVQILTLELVISRRLFFQLCNLKQTKKDLC
jgi:hypothetical protein